ncbi:hypothetical protein ABZ897_51180 [Nonomuraea sp. NPDC046802]|uniref:hypothetical protein n=1 Tax=Nonomuraea sp. NPDC046802 TaxID=3154919 RepID=UPI0033C5DF7B
METEFELSTVTYAELQERAMTGWAYFDQEHDGWWQEVPVDLLDLQVSDLCVLGLLYGTFDIGLAKHGLSKGASIPLGLFTRSGTNGKPLPDYEEQYRALTLIWGEEIITRQSA